MQATWKKPEARAAAELMAKDAAELFGIEAPPVILPEHCTGREWEYRTETAEVWTKAGRAEFSVSISPRFAHLYFRFDDPARAVQFDNGAQRLNRFSGKWNHICTPDSWAKNGKPCPKTSLETFRAELRRDFRKVAEPNPPANEVAAYRAKEAIIAARFSQYMAKLDADAGA